MVQSIQPGRFGHSGKPDDAWLAKQEKEPILEPQLPIIDTHHHLWDRGGWTYLLPELLADLNTGHNIIATVFEECRSMYRANGPVEMRPVGEVEFVAGIAAMSASGGFGPINLAISIEPRPLKLRPRRYKLPQPPRRVRRTGASSRSPPTPTECAVGTDPPPATHSTPAA